MTALDWTAVAFAAGAGLVGLRRGLLVSGLSLAGVALGALLGGRLAPHLLPAADASPYTPLIALAGAVTLAFLLEGVGALTGGALRGALPARALRTLDSAGGLLLGAATGLALVWVLGAVALQVPGQTSWRQAAQRSIVLQRLNELVPPRRVLRPLRRVDPSPALTGPAVLVEPPDPRVLRRAGVREAAPSVVRVLGTACGLGVAGSGWVAGPGLVVTAAHVVAGQDDTTVVTLDPAFELDAHAVSFDVRNDVAILRVEGLAARPLPLARGKIGDAVAVLGYPDNGPFDARPGRIGRTVAILGEDAYGDGPVLRSVTAFRASIQHGNSGGPAVNARGAVETTVFASRLGGEAGCGVPTDIVRRALDRARGEVSTGECAP
ncbi:MAG: MarP family serine protease [Gaiellaceae bacterium]